ncbi:hypothetical protein [Nostoc punctiforme]|uniref:Uncharacterized protein n=1 Tax=Nostoc punctiforme (strain ATCC 29133 / PCC 73102) TaxID=63737 RepID=B2J1H3_NOSP7|nr:hypothetical protein [Nostoc punctiforme]ACC80334.1 hypothetical protein Npun_F1662 [Nostoc punctiforme PCC 73102]
MVYANGQTQETSRRLYAGNFLDQREGLGGLQASSRSYGTESLRSNQVNSSKENPLGRTNEYRDTPPGKILERLKLIEGSYLSHLKKLEQKLECQLDETRGEEESFKAAIQELEQEIYNLVSTSDRLEPPNQNNGHNE